MRKLMVIAALMCAAVSAQAVEWTFSIDNVRDRNFEYYTGAATLTCDALGLSQGINIVNGALESDVCVELNSASNTKYTFLLTATDGEYSYSEAKEFNSGTLPYPSVFIPGGYYGTWTKNESSNPVPEPTSGLLLLIGMAGLALKRKRA